MEDPVSPVINDHVRTLNGINGTGGEHAQVHCDENSVLHSSSSTKDSLSLSQDADQCSAPKKSARSSEGMADWIDSLRKLLDHSTTVEDLNSLNSFLIAVRTQIRDEVSARVSKKEEELLEVVCARDQELARLQEVMRVQHEIFEQQMERERQRYKESIELSERRAKEQDHKYGELKSFVEILRMQSTESSERLCRELELAREKELHNVTHREQKIADQRVKEEKMMKLEQEKQIEELRAELKEEEKLSEKQLEEMQKKHDECMQLMDNTAHEILATRLHRLEAGKDEEMEVERQKLLERVNKGEETLRTREEAIAKFEAEVFEKEEKWLSSFGKVKHLKCVREAFNTVVLRRRSRPNPDGSPSPLNRSMESYSVLRNGSPLKRTTSNTSLYRHRFMDHSCISHMDKSVGSDYSSMDAPPRRHSDENVYAPLPRDLQTQRRRLIWEATRRSKSQPRSQRSTTLISELVSEVTHHAGGCSSKAVTLHGGLPLSSSRGRIHGETLESCDVKMSTHSPVDIPTMVTQPSEQANGSYGGIARSPSGGTDREQQLEEATEQEEQQQQRSADESESQASRVRGARTDVSAGKRGLPSSTLKASEKKTPRCTHGAPDLILRDGNGEFVIRKEAKLNRYKELLGWTG